MGKKSFIYLTIFGSLMVFGIFPLFNFSVDPWRVLNKDYHQMYQNIEPNLNSLKVNYLIENKERYDTVFMGSSKIGNMDAARISKKSYNMTYSFGLAGVHLSNLKILLKNNVNIENIWLGINDYVIWKDPISFDNDFLRRPKKQGLLQEIDRYVFYAFKQVTQRDADIFNGKYPLVESKLIIEPNDMGYRRKKEANFLKNPNKWIVKVAGEKSTLLGYKDTKYRINEAIEEIREFIKICHENEINLTIFTYPMYYKNFLQYNQDKINHFKKELSKITDFYDFYTINDMALNELKWFNNNHFTPSVGDKMLDIILKDQFKVTSENIDQHIDQSKIQLNDVFRKNQDKIIAINVNNSFVGLKNIFDINVDSFKFTGANSELEKSSGFQLLTVHDKGDPQIILNQTRAHGDGENVLFNAEIYSLKQSFFQLYFKKDKESKYSKERVFNFQIKKGLNKLKLIIPKNYINNNLRIDPASSIGEFYIHKLNISSI